VERDLLGMYGQFTANPPVGAAGTPVTEATIDTAETALFAAKVPPSAPKYLVVDSNTYSQIRQIPRFSEYYSAGEAGLRALVEGNVGKIKDFFIFRSQYVPVTGTASPNTHNLAFTRDGIGLVIRRLPQPLPGTGAVAEYAEMGNFGLRVVMSYQPNTLSQQFTVDVLYGTGVLRNAFAVQVNS
jgi:P22 coat protein - gene protein 5